MKCRACGRMEAGANGYCEDCNELERDMDRSAKLVRMAPEDSVLQMNREATAAYNIKINGMDGASIEDLLDAMMYHCRKITELTRNTRGQWNQGEVKS